MTNSKKPSQKKRVKTDSNQNQKENVESNSSIIRMLSKKIDVRIDELQNELKVVAGKVTKRKIYLFHWIQLIGTLGILIAWVIQNNRLSKMDGEKAFLQTIHQNVSDLNTKMTLYEIEISLLKSRDSAKVDFIDFYIQLGNLLMGKYNTIIAIDSVLLGAMPYELINEHDPNEIVRESWKNSQFDFLDSLTKEVFICTLNYKCLKEKELIFFEISSNSFQKERSLFKYEQELFERRKRSFTVFKIFYIIGGGLLVFGLLKDIPQLKFFAAWWNSKQKNT